jgi:transposase
MPRSIIVAVAPTEVERLKQENDLLRQENALLKRQLFGAKSEKVILDHPDLFDCSGLDPVTEEEVQDNSPPTGRRKSSASPRKPRIPDHLEIRETVIIPPEVKANPDLWKPIGSEDHCDRIAFEPGTFYVKRITRPKFVRADCPADEPNPPVIADLPPQLLDRGVLAPELLAHIAVSKYSDHLPLDRQSKIFGERYGVEISPQTMGNGIELVADWLRPIVDLMSKEQFKSNYFQCDETTIKYLKPNNGKAATGYIWTVNVPGGYTVYHWKRGRGQKCLDQIVPEDFEGTLQCDGYIGYYSFRNSRPMVTLNGCMAHVRRKFVEALEIGQSPTQMRWVVNQMRLLYQIERRLREMRAGPAKRAAVRCAESVPIMNRIRKALELLKKRPNFRPQTLMGKAVSYALNQWEVLQPWLTNGQIEIDNNLVENKIRPTKLGLKNWLFLGADGAGWRSTVIYSIINSCRNFGIEPYTYMVDVLNRLPSMKNSELPNLLPDRWLEERRSAGRV